MASYNKVILMGNLTRDPQLSNLPSGSSVTRFGMAVNRKWKGADGQQKEEVLFVDCDAFGKTGEVINQYKHKGDSLLVEGRLALDQWTDKEGNKRSKHKIVVEGCQFVGGKPDQAEQRPAPQRAPAPAQSEPEPEDFGGDNVPF